MASPRYDWQGMIAAHRRDCLNCLQGRACVQLAHLQRIERGARMLRSRPEPWLADILDGDD